MESGGGDRNVGGSRGGVLVRAAKRGRGRVDFPCPARFTINIGVGLVDMGLGNVFGLDWLDLVLRYYKGSVWY